MSCQLHYRLQAIEKELNKINLGRAPYRRIHLLGKLITCLLVELGMVYVGASLIIKLTTVMWFFGPNFFSYLIESILKEEHRHDPF